MVHFLEQVRIPTLCLEFEHAAGEIRSTAHIQRIAVVEVREMNMNFALQILHSDLRFQFVKPVHLRCQ